ncbi:hypothetical protein ABZ401_12855 [Streptomyces sp. NPDC005892]|uniref:hypothetical protein n=1 Tax=Streptomyces sp. NPDC005892 TaxID=3155593 RepID=UPI0033E60485
MAAPTKPKPVLEHYYNLKQACDRLGLSDPENPDDKRGQKWMRVGVNTLNFPCHRMAGQLKFSDSDLAEIAELHRNRRHGNSVTRKRRMTRKAPLAAAA